MQELDPLIKMMARLPGLGPRSAKRTVLHLLKKPQSLMLPLAETLRQVADTIQTCHICGNIDVHETCSICRDTGRDRSTLCLVEDIDDLWAIERTKTFKGTYHILGGVLSALDGVLPEDLNIAPLLNRLDGVNEIIMALSATVDGQATAHYVDRQIRSVAPSIHITYLAHGVPVGGELDYLDDGTLSMALEKRQALS